MYGQTEKWPYMGNRYYKHLLNQIGKHYQDERGKYHTCRNILKSTYPNRYIMSFDTGKFEYDDHVEVYWTQVDKIPGKQLNLF